MAYSEEAKAARLARAAKDRARLASSRAKSFKEVQTPKDVETEGRKKAANFLAKVNTTAGAHPLEAPNQELGQILGGILSNTRSPQSVRATTSPDYSKAVTPSQVHFAHGTGVHSLVEKAVETLSPRNAEDIFKKTEQANLALEKHIVAHKRGDATAAQMHLQDASDHLRGAISKIQKETSTPGFNDGGTIVPFSFLKDVAKGLPSKYAEHVNEESRGQSGY